MTQFALTYIGCQWVANKFVFVFEKMLLANQAILKAARGMAQTAEQHAEVFVKQNANDP